jgi:hypothetical protein
MNSVCEICNIMINEGHVCCSCRPMFNPLTNPNIKLDVNCDKCNTYWFPCHSCATHIFGGRLGKGNGKLNDDIMEVEEMVQILEEYIQTNPSDNQTTQSDNLTESYVKIDNHNDNLLKKKGYYNSYCSLQ